MEIRIRQGKPAYSFWRTSFKRFFLKKIPFISLILRKANKFTQYAFWRFKVLSRKRKSPIDLDRIYWTNPDNIIFCTEKEFHAVWSDGLVLLGDWDISNKKFENLDTFQALHDHFVNHAKWESTTFYKRIVKSINTKSGLHWGCLTEEEFKNRCINLDALFIEIKSNGFKTQESLAKGFLGIQKIDEISVNLSRTGQLLFNDGAHRLSMAKILRIQKIPIKVTVCHQDCTNFQLLLPCPHNKK